MITKDELGKLRSIRGLYQFVWHTRKKVCKVKFERYKAIQKCGLYKIFNDEIVPLSCIALKLYPSTYKIKPVVSNQEYDAIIMNEEGNIIDYLEITWPQDGKRKADDAQKILTRKYGNIYVYYPGEDIEELCKYILKTCQNKAKKDYSNCTLVIVIDFVPPFPEHRQLYLQKLKQIIKQVKNIQFRAKRVFLFILPFCKIYKICG